MKLSNLSFHRLLPSWMRDDLADIGLSKGVEKVNAQTIAPFPWLSLWEAIDVLDDDDLDELAWEFNLIWYSKKAPKETKRDLVKNGLQVWRHLGTVWAVENVITAYFGEGYLQEWFEYQGIPGHFAVYTSNPRVTDDKLSEFMYVLNRVKRFTAKLDAIYITFSSSIQMSAGVEVHEYGIEQYRIGATL